MSRRLAAALLAPLVAAGCCRPCAPRCGDPCADARPAAAPAPMPVPMPVATQPPMPVPMPDARPAGNCARVVATAAATQPPPAPAPSTAPAPAPAAATDDAKLFLEVHLVRDLVNGDEAKMERLLAKVRAFATAPGGSVAQQGLVAIVVKAPRRVQALVEGVLRSERQPLRLKYFDVKDLLAAQQTLLDDLRPLLGSVEGRTIDLKNGTLIVRASGEVLDAIQAKLEGLRASK